MEISKVDIDHSPEQAQEYAKGALARMKERGVPANPRNFTVWYLYCSDTNPDLSRTLDILIDNNQSFTDERNTEIYRKFFTREDESAALSIAADNIDSMLRDIMTYLGLAGDGAAEYGKILEAFTGKIDKTEGADDLKTIITGVLSETRTVVQVNKVLEKKLEDSSRQVIELKEDLEDMRREATTDALTGIANRKLFDQTLRLAATQAMEDGTDLSLLMIDIDHFKKFNDTYGHQVGDQVLRLLGTILASSTKGKDTSARYGGEEFCIILPDTGLGDAVKVAELIRHAVGDKILTNRKTGEDMGRISVTIGAGLFDFGEPLNQLISRADRALYLGKSNGRNRVVSQDKMKDLELVFDS